MHRESQSSCASCCVLALACIGALGCHAVDPSDSNLAKRIDVLEGKLAALQDIHKLDVFNLADALEDKADRNADAELETVSPGSYGVASTTSGRFFVLLQRAESAGDGTRLSLSVGNPHSATFNSYKLRIAWSKSRPYAFDRKTLREWTNSHSAVVCNPATSLKPAYWTNATCAIPVAKPQEIGYLRISMDVDNVMLLRGAVR